MPKSQEPGTLYALQLTYFTYTMVRFDFKKISFSMIALYIVAALILGLGLYFSARSPALWIGLVLLTILVVNFYSVRVTIDENWICVSYGIGMVVKATPLAEIRSVTLCPNSFLGPWWYYPQAQEVVSIETRHGKRIIFFAEKAQSIIEMIRTRVDF